ncbi:hypothetical protein [Psychrobacter sp. AOP7-A1-24]|uniref:hypothetical protein n=1 Tax=Psychrobacter sp. AOP7-A1-24 TaxID=3457646 RepID=UPI00402B85DA
MKNIAKAIKRHYSTKAFYLRIKGHTAVAVVSFGYCSKGDLNTELPKSRFNEKTTIMKA